MSDASASHEGIMFLRYFDFIFAPFRAINNKIIGVKNIKGNFKGDIMRAKSLGARGKDAAARVARISACGESPWPGITSSAALVK